MAKFGINDILNAKTKAAGQQAQTDGYKEIYLSPYEVKAAQENTHQKLENIEELADSFLHVGQEQPTVLARVNGEYRIIDGHRRNAANILNLERGHKEYEKVLYRFMDMSEAKTRLNPNMGVSVKESFFMDEIAVAEGSLSKKAEFLTKYCNIKQNSSIAWLEYQTVENAGVEKTLEDFRDCYAVGGIDLSQTTDLTAASVVIQKDGTLYAFTQFFMPRGRLEYLQATDGVPYDIFVKKGLITLSGENYVDYHDVYDWFTMLLEDYGIRPLKIGYDRYSAQYLITDMANYGFHMDDVYQGENLTPVIREFEGIIKDGDFKIADNNLLKTHFLNVALKHNMETRKFRPIKIEQRAHIDGFVSVIDAMTVRQKYWEECGELLKNAA